MSKKVIWIDGVPHRNRRGKLVPIPAEWFGQVTSDHAKRKRYSHNRIKKIDSKGDRARQKDALIRGEESNDRRTKTVWYAGESGNLDAHRNKYRRERKESHPSRDPAMKSTDLT